MSRALSTRFVLSPLLVGAMVLAVGCTSDKPDPAPVAGLVKSADLPGSPKQQALNSDGTPLNGCSLDSANSFKDRSGHRRYVQYKLGDTVVKSFVYTYLITRKLNEDWTFLVNGQKRCEGGNESEPDGSYSLLTDLPANTTGYDALHRDDYQVYHAQRVWVRKDSKTVLSVEVTRTVDRHGDTQRPNLPVDAKALLAKVAAE